MLLRNILRVCLPELILNTLVINLYLPPPLPLYGSAFQNPAPEAESRKREIPPYLYELLRREKHGARQNAERAGASRSGFRKTDGGQVVGSTPPCEGGEKYLAWIITAGLFVPLRKCDAI